jgi:hypothetical protein
MNLPQKARQKDRSMFNRIALTLVFTLSFLTYLAPDVTATLQLIPLILFAFLVFLRLFCSNSVLTALCSLFDIDGLLFVFFLSVFLLGPSMASTYDKSFGVALTICVCLILARLYMAVVPIREVLEAFFWSGLLSLGIFIPLTFVTLLQSVATLERFSPFGFHPNLLAFVLAGYFCAMIWKIVTGRRRVKVLAAIVGLADLVFIFFASSRGAIVGLIAGCTIAGGLATLRTDKERKKKFLRWCAMAGALLLGLILLVRSSELFNNTVTFVDEVLELTDSYRGVGTGFSGRFERWNQVMSMFGDGTFLLGKGLRYSDSSDATAVDNSYIALLYEVGIIPFILITWRFSSILRRFVKAFFDAVNPESRSLYLAFTLQLIVLLMINIVDRYLFGVGNPYSLFAFLVFATPSSTMERWLTEPERHSRRLANPVCPALQPSSQHRG